MLRILRSIRRDSVVLTVAGRIEGETLAELKRVIGLETRDRELVLDLVDVTLIDQAAILYLAQCSQDWPVLCNCPAYIRKWIVAEKERHPATTD